MLEPLYTADEMRAAETGHDVDQLMARAGRAVAEEAMRRFPQARRFVAVCGGGANGGDGRIAVDVLRSAGREAVVSDDVAGADMILDALFGTGFHGAPREDAARKIEAINAAGAPVVAVDLPSGVNASTGEVAGACAEGAPSLAAEAAFRADAGYVAVAAPESTLPVFEQRLLEAVKLPCPEDGGRISPRAIEPIVEFADKAGAVALGPGLGRGPGPREVVSRLLAELEVPVVVDADALFELEPFDRSAPTVVTPHEGELARLLGEESRWVAAHRLEAAKRGAERFGCVCLLKGADTLIAEPGQGVWVCS